MHQAAAKVEEIFYEALEFESPEARSAFLDRVCGDVELRRRVEGLIANHLRAGSNRFVSVDLAVLKAILPVYTSHKLP